MRTFTTILRVVGTLVILVVGWVAYDYASRFFDRALRLVFQAAPTGGKVQTMLHSHWADVVGYGEWAIIGLMALIVFVVLRRVWSRR